MKQETQETRSETIFRHTQQMLHELRITMQTYSVDLVGWYHEHVPPAARCVHFKTEGDTYRCVATNAQHLNRYMDAEINVRLPVDLEEAWVHALQEPYRSRCISDLAQRYGLLAVAAPSADSAGGFESIGRISHEFGHVLQAWAPIAADGVRDAADLPHLPAAIRELDDLIAAAMSMRAALTQQLAGST